MIGIWSKKDREIMNRTLAFRKQITVDSMCIRIAASSLYRLMIDGEFYGYGPARAAHGYSRVDEYSLAEFNGETVVITVEVFASCVNTFYVVDEPPFFAAEIVKDGEIICNAQDFAAFEMNDRLTKVQRFSFQRSFVEDYRMKRCRSNFYKGNKHSFPVVETKEVSINKLLDRNVSYPKLETLYAESEDSGIIGKTTPKQLWQDRCLTNISETFKGYKREELEECLSDEICGFRFDDIEVCEKKGVYQSFDFKRTVTGFLKFNANVKTQTNIYVIWDEVKDGNGRVAPFRNTCCNCIKYNLKPGEYELLSFEANTARFAQVIVFGNADISDFSMVLYQNPDADNFKIDIDDKQLSDIFEAARNTFAQNAVDILTDCPSRERAGWLCDSYFSSRSERLLTGKNKVEKNFLENYILAPQSPFLPENMIPMCYPADFNDGVFIPNWSMWFVLELKNYLKATNDIELIQRAKEKVYGLVKYFSQFLNQDGLLENLTGWVFIEWSRCNDADCVCGVNFPSNMLYAAMLKTVDELYGDKELRLQSKKIKDKIKELSFDGEFFKENAIRKDGKLSTTGILTETCQYYAFYFGVATKEEYPELYNLMLEKFGPSRDLTTTYPNVAVSNAIVGNYLRLELLLRDKMYDAVIKECKEFFTKMADTTGTLWEHSKQSASLNHGFASVVAEYIVKCLNRE